MTAPHAPKIVIALAFFALLAACHSKAPDSTPVVAGAGSALGQALTANEWCGETRVDDDRHLVTDRFLFQPRGGLLVTSSELQTDGTTKTIAASEGTWSLVEDQLTVARGPETLHARLATNARVGGSVDCLAVRAAGRSLRLCACPQ